MDNGFSIVLRKFIYAKIYAKTCEINRTLEKKVHVQSFSSVA